VPIYEYKCPKCDTVIEELQGFDDPAPECEKCLKEQKKIKMQKIISRTSFQLKGGGWYKDGYQK